MDDDFNRKMKNGGEIGIRTLGTLTSTPHFECGAFDHSAISPHVQTGKVEALFRGDPFNRARPLAQDFRFAKRKVETNCYSRDIAMMNPNPPLPISAPITAEARFAIGEVVRHRLFEFRGVVFDIDPVFANSEEWYQFHPRTCPPA